ncbi:glycoside hydrolase family 76 protein [Polyplosphaeria fusca]|uniref:Mannan endo-1,6-alpha-mannosidase n=1 Tax=Polyplosphaeria fusca TaxID=682080 RepID=A0A9P4QPZ9_9PLEO|nr:glycoside hydrolase family 76 protein [Polyplosphaeria fusca]
MKLFSSAGLLAFLYVIGCNVLPAAAIDLDPTQPGALYSIRNAAKTVAKDMVAMYANQDAGGTHVISGIPGLLTYPPYYWWEAGAMFGSLIEYWYYTNDSTYNDMVRDGILFQVGEKGNLMPANQSKDEGNDDQLFWAFAVMSAAELGFENPTDPKQPGWLAIAQSVMNQLISRWDTTQCSGGLKWQIYQWLDGYNYKNTAANGGMFQLGARLAMYTGNATYAEWATKAFDWLVQSPLLTKDWQVYDGTNSLAGCKDADQLQWTYNYGIMLGGAAYMYNYTNGSSLWADRLSGFLNHTPVFFPKAQNNVMVEVACEITQKCDVDQWSFKAYLSRWLAISAQLAPFTAPQIMPMLQHSATAAAKQCSGGDSGTQCGSRWFYEQYDGNGGVGQQMSALNVISANMIAHVQPPFNAKNGGSSQGNPAAGTGDDNPPTTVVFEPMGTGDKAGAAILTILVLGTWMGGAWWMVS